MAQNPYWRRVPSIFGEGVLEQMGDTIVPQHS